MHFFFSRGNRLISWLLFWHSVCLHIVVIFGNSLLCICPDFICFPVKYIHFYIILSSLFCFKELKNGPYMAGQEHFITLFWQLMFWAFFFVVAAVVVVGVGGFWWAFGLEIIHPIWQHWCWMIQNMTFLIMSHSNWYAKKTFTRDNTTQCHWFAQRHIIAYQHCFVFAVEKLNPKASVK